MVYNDSSGLLLVTWALAFGAMSLEFYSSYWANILLGSLKMVLEKIMSNGGLCVSDVRGEEALEKGRGPGVM